jgi:hypothetical protein
VRNATGPESPVRACDVGLPTYASQHVFRHLALISPTRKAGLPAVAHTAVVCHCIPKGAEEPSVRMRQPHMQVVAESSRTNARAGAGAGLAEPDYKVAKNSHGVAAGPTD